MADQPQYIVNPSLPAGSLAAGGLTVVPSASSLPPGTAYYYLSPSYGVFYSPDTSSTSAPPATAPTAPSGGGSALQAGASVSRVGGGGSGDIIVRLTATDVSSVLARQCPARMMLPDEIVEVVAIAGNTGNVNLSTSGPAAAIGGPNMVLTPTGVPRQLNVRVLSEAWIAPGASAATGDGVSFSIRHAARQ